MVLIICFSLLGSCCWWVGAHVLSTRLLPSPLATALRWRWYLGFVTNPEALIEWLIAVSIWVLALELSRPEQKSRLWDKPWYLAGGFGLLHGMGFAGALAETGLPQMHLPTALLFFNVGIEVGQLAFIAVLTAAGGLISKIIRAHWLQFAPVYLLGAVSTFWVLDRSGSLFG